MLVVPLVVMGQALMKPTVVMVHGAGGGGWEYVVWKREFERAGYPVVARDLVPAKGGLAKTTFSDYVRQVKSWLPRQGRFVLVGASMGGPLVLKAAVAKSPAAVVLVNAVAPAGVGSRRAGAPSPPVVKWAGGPLQDTVDAMPDSDEAMVQYAWKRWRDESGAVIDALRRGVPCAKPSCPTLVVVGDADTDVPPADSLALARWAGAAVHEYRGMSHVGPLMSKRADVVAGAVVEWLGRLVSRPTSP